MNQIKFMLSYASYAQVTAMFRTSCIKHRRHELNLSLPLLMFCFSQELKSPIFLVVSRVSCSLTFTQTHGVLYDAF